MRYFVQEHLDRTVYHGGIGNVDAEKIFLQKGFSPLRFPAHYDFSITGKFRRFFYLAKTVLGLPRNAVVYFQFPLYARMDGWLIRLLGFRKSVRIVCFLTDIDGIKDGDSSLLRREIRQLRRYACFIVHNEVMKQWLLSKTNPAVVETIDFFDFLSSPARLQRQKSYEIAFAGNLEKSGFLHSLSKLNETAPGLIFNVYGQHPSAALLQQHNVSYRGFLPPYQLPEVLEGAFGLVWDGDAIEAPAGSLGDYMRYISPHKLSLYIMSGMPLIVCSQAAAALLVKKYKIGFGVESLEDLQNAIAEISEENYRQMAENTKQLAKAISAGQMLGHAIDEVTRKLAAGRTPR